MAMAQIDYDTLPYSSMPFAESQPTHLAALAALHSCSAPAVETARVLELGCASGGNLIPLAVRFPNAVFEGVDLSERHAREGASLIADLGLSNITIRQGDIGTLDVSDKRYDYIICHGVFSWVPKPVQEAIFRICATSLTENGIAYVSYNVLPGWHFRMIIRDICKYQQDVDSSPQSQIAKARATLHQMAQLADETSLFGKVLREEAQRSTQMNDSLFQGEFLSADNDPCHFHEFVDRANSHGLAYLCDAGLADFLPETFAPDRREAAGRLAGNSMVKDQYIDHFTGRAFRRSLLVKDSASTERVIGPGGLAHLHLACPLGPEESKDGAFILRQDKAELKTNDPVVGTALVYLATVYPETRSFAELVTHVEKTTGHKPTNFTARMADALLRTIKSGYLTASAYPLRVGRVVDENPTLWPLARAQLRRNQPWLSTLLHVPIQIAPALRSIAALLDGTNTQAQIEARLAAAIASREIVIDGVNESSGPEAQREHARRLLRSGLHGFHRNALLCPSP